MKIVHHVVSKIFQLVKDNPLSFKTYFKLENNPNILTSNEHVQYDINLAKEIFNNEHIDYHIEFFRAGLNAIIKKWLNNNCKESPEEMVKIITSEYKKKN